MLLWSLEVILLSLVFIFVVHQLFLFFLTNLTVPRTKDLVYRPAQAYDNIYKLIGNGQRTHTESDAEGTTLDDLVTRANTQFNATASSANSSLSSGKQSMKNELKNFLKQQWSSDKPGGSSSSNVAAEPVDAWNHHDNSDTFSVTSLHSSSF